MSSDAQVVARFNDAIAEVGGGASDCDDWVMNTWYKSNFGDLLQPAPMAIGILGNLSILASSVEFKLVPPRGGFQQVRYPDSFRATITQLVDAGAIALQKSYANFDEMQKRCIGVKPGVNNIVDLLAGEGSSSEAEANTNIRTFLPRQISQLQHSVSACLQKAQETDTIFQDLLNLTMEIHESCMATQGDNDTKIQDAKMRETILNEQKIALEQNKKVAAQQQADARKNLEEAQCQFNKAADQMPNGWEVIGMQFVEGLSNAVLNILNIGINRSLAKSQEKAQKQNAAINRAGGIATAPGTLAIQQNASDPAYQQAHVIYTTALALEALVTGGPDKSVDWTKASAEVQGGARWIKNMLEVASAGPWTSDPASVQAKKLTSDGSKLAQDLAELGPNSHNTAVVEPIVKSINNFVVDALKFSTAAFQKTGTMPVQSPGFASPMSPPKLSSGSAAQIAVKSAQYKIEATQQQLEFARKMSQDSTNKLLQVTESLGHVLGQVAQLNLQSINWAEVRSILLRAISFLCQLKSCLADLVHFFSAVNLLVGVTMKDTCTQFINLIEDATKANKSVGGVTLSNWTRQAIYNQAIGAAKVSKLVERISGIYVTMYDLHVQEGVKRLLLMGRWIGGDEGTQAQLRRAGTELQTWARGASMGITALIGREQAKMEEDIQARMVELQTAIKGILPPPSNSIKQAITDATQASIVEVSSAIDAADSNKPVFKTGLGRRMRV